MTLDDYQRAALSTAIYPKEKGLEYTALGLCGEVGEMASKVEAWNFSRPEDRDDALGELGDVCWYLATHAHELGSTLSSIGTLADAAPSPDAGHSDVSVVLSMAAAAGEIANKTKKVIRDNRPVASVAEHNRAQLARILAAARRFAPRFESTLEAVCAANAAKLASRKERGKIGGDGDKR